MFRAWFSRLSPRSPNVSLLAGLMITRRETYFAGYRVTDVMRDWVTCDYRDAWLSLFVILYFIVHVNIFAPYVTREPSAQLNAIRELYFMREFKYLMIVNVTLCRVVAFCGLHEASIENQITSISRGQLLCPATTARACSETDVWSSLCDPIFERDSFR